MASPPEDKTLYIKPINLASLTVTYTGSNAGTFTLTNFRTTTYNGETYLALTREVGITSGVISAPGYFGDTFSLPDGINECFVELKPLGSLYAWTSVKDLNGSPLTIYTNTINLNYTDGYQLLDSNGDVINYSWQEVITTYTVSTNLHLVVGGGTSATIDDSIKVEIYSYNTMFNEYTESSIVTFNRDPSKDVINTNDTPQDTPTDKNEEKKYISNIKVNGEIYNVKDKNVYTKKEVQSIINALMQELEFDPIDFGNDDEDGEDSGSTNNCDVTISLGTMSSAHIAQLIIGDTVVGEDTYTSNISSTINGKTYSCPKGTVVRILVHPDIHDYTNPGGVLDVNVNGVNANFSNANTTSGSNCEVTYTVNSSETITISATGHEGCVLYNTPILYTDGTTKAIERVNVGDSILGYDTKTNEYVKVSVLQVFETTDDSIVKLTLEDNSILELTKNHIIYTKRGWSSYSGKMEERYTEKDVTSVYKLEIGDKVLCINGIWKELINIEISEGEYRVFNLDVSDNYNTYVAGGIVTHNASSVTSGVDPIFPIDPE